jgi:hypothetical protein
MAKLMYHGAARRAGPEHRDDVGVGHPWELVAHSGEVLNVISEGFTRLLPTTLQVPRVARPHICALEVAGEDLPKILLAINDISWQMIQPSPSNVI